MVANDQCRRRFTGADTDFDLHRHDARKPEFEAWTWATPQAAIERIVPWKRELYVTVLKSFAQTIADATPNAMSEPAPSGP